MLGEQTKTNHMEIEPTLQLREFVPQSRFSEYHLILEAPQHATAARLASVGASFFRLLSPSILQDLRASKVAACRLATVHQQAISRPCVIAIAFTVDALPLLCHFPEPFFKDLQTKFPEIFRARSGIHRSCFTLRVFTKNRQKPEPPQHTPAKALAIVQSRVTHLMSPSILQDLRAINALAFTLGPLAPRPLGPFFRLLSPSVLDGQSPSLACASGWYAATIRNE